MVQRKRHLAKAVSYRFFGTFGTAAAAYVITGNLKVGAAIGLFDTVGKIGLYYIHERFWYRIKWGVHPAVDHAPSRPRRTATHHEHQPAARGAASAAGVPD